MKGDARIAAVKDTCKKASLVNGKFGILAISVYDNKPVRIMSTKDKDSVFIRREHQWFDEQGRESVRPYQRLLLTHLYNQYMYGVDLQDQLHSLVLPPGWQKDVACAKVGMVDVHRGHQHRYRPSLLVSRDVGTRETHCL